MKTKFIFLLNAFMILTTSLVLAEVSQPPTSVTIPVKTDQTEQAHQLQSEGKYLEAQKIYEEILQQPDLAGEEAEKIRKDYEDLNIQILFSRIETSTSSLHEVVPGDTLSGISKKYKTTIDLIKKSNGLQSDMIRLGMKLKIETGKFSIQIDKSDNLLTLLLNEKPIKHYHVATGANNGTPVGTFHIINKLENPTWYKAGAIVPPDSPKNILGTRWMGFDNPGFGIHGTTIPESIGHQATSGCVRMLNNEVEELYIFIPTGTEVTIAD